MFKDKPPRLDLIFQRFNAPVYFITFNTHTRTSLFATPQVHAAFIEFCRSAGDFSYWRRTLRAYARPHSLVRMLWDWSCDDFEHMD